MTSRFSFRVSAVCAIAVSLIGIAPVVAHADAQAKRLRTRIARPLHPVEVNRSSHWSRREVWKRKLPLFDQPSSGTTLLPRGAQPKPGRVSTGTTLDFWALTPSQRIDLRWFLRRGSCPEDIFSGMREICLDMLSRVRIPAERPQQFNRGDGR